MKLPLGLSALPLILGVVTLVAATLGADEVRRETPVDFAREILPILSNKCFVCHGPDVQEEDQLRLDSFEAATGDRGGYRAIDPDAPEKSEILVRIHSADDPMPPEDAEKQLTPQERDLISRWVRQGGKYAKHWAFVPPRKQPPRNNLAVAENEIDAYVVGHLQEKGITPAPEADRATLARRAALVLTGLPPEPEQLSAFLADNGADAYERLVDELLDSPALRRTSGALLAGRRALRRHPRPAPGQPPRHLPLPRLGRARAEREPAARRFHYLAARRRPAAQSDA